MKQITLCTAISLALSAPAFGATYSVNMIDVDGKIAQIRDVNANGDITGILFTEYELKEGEETPVYCGEDEKEYTRTAFSLTGSTVREHRSDEYRRCIGYSSGLMTNTYDIKLAIKDNGDVVGGYASLPDPAFGVFGTTYVNFSEQLDNIFSDNTVNGSTSVLDINSSYNLAGTHKGNAVIRINDVWQEIVNRSGSGPSHTAIAINESNQVLVNTSHSYGFSSYAIWENGNSTPIGEVGGSTGGFRSMSASDLNDGGYVVGVDSSGRDGEGPFAYISSVTSTERLPSLEGFEIVHPSGLNNSNVIVGMAFLQQYNVTGAQAVIYENGTWTNLNDLIDPNSGWNLVNAIDITDDGTIYGNGLYNGEPRIYVLYPGAEPVGTMHLRGSFNDWGALEMGYSEGFFAASVELEAGDQFKFDANADWSENYGDDNSDGVAGAGEDNIQVTETGTYLIRLNPTTLGYSIEQQGPVDAFAAVNFACERGNTEWGQSVFVVGSGDALGNWNPENAVALGADMYPLWTGTVEGLDANSSYEWKCIKKQGSSVEWQSGGNNMALTGEAGSATNATGSF